MSNNDSATEQSPIALGGLGLAALGVLAFSFTFPATVFALDGLDPYVVGVGRSAIGSVLAVIALLAFRARGASARPRGGQWGRLAIVGAGVVFGFPVLTTLALDHGSSAAHAAVIVGLLPATTAIYAVLRAGERPSPAFWAAAAAGAAVITGFTLVQGAGGITAADLLLFAALLAAAAGYSEGGRMAREMPGWRVISWALVLTAPISLPVTGWLLATTEVDWTAGTALGLAYVAAVSGYMGFFAWYEGLGRAGIARASQIQLAQPLLTILWSGILLAELIDMATGLAAVGVLVCVALAQRARVAITAPQNNPAEDTLASYDTFAHDGSESVTTTGEPAWTRD